MSKGLRLTEKWLQRALWLVALAFGGFLIGLGGRVVANLQDVEAPLEVRQFLDHAQYDRAETERGALQERREVVNDALGQARQRHRVAADATAAARETFDNWIATRQVTARPEQDAELIRRTGELDRLKAAEQTALATVQAQEQARLDIDQALQRVQARMEALERPAYAALDRARTAMELRVFGYRLALTLPLLLVAGWLFARKRHSQYWPFVWGFIFFALFAFFFELVPYLPSYGGYVRYAVGIVLTVIVGRYAIVSLQRYLARQKAAEAMPDAQRRETLRYDVALARLNKGVCPGCERAVDLKDGVTDFCPHCGIGLFARCGRCNARKNVFTRFCFSCGTPADTHLAD